MKPARLSTGAPMPPPVWQILCEFANGSCVCAHTEKDDPPCHAVTVVERRIRDRLYHDIAETHHVRRKAARP
ncbi:hypothetical protein [Neomesorhizobium albiziae]|uniref:hypothetical protein n=1 Tax=Neomesorhizobium albiziae TaxID=335020 RepID=UPI00122D3160|nr:hypothetical protein [Mesorhizobium albiziae]GLS29940.1 hypothetical protein GCM10007937_16480 [Mesorhizobium albiziae]